MDIIASILLIISGLVLTGAAANRVPLIGKHLARAGAWLAGFATIIGAVDIVLGIIGLVATIGMGIFAPIFLIVSGLVLIGAAGNKVPLIGKHLARAGAWLTGLAYIIGPVDIVLGIIVLLP